MSIILSRINLYVDFRYLNKRCREVTSLKDNQANRNKLAKILERIEAEILLDIFDYAKYFPKSKQLQVIESIRNQQLVIETKTPTFEVFYQIWFAEIAMSLNCRPRKALNWQTPLEAFAQLVDYHSAFKSVAPHV